MERARLRELVLATGCAEERGGEVFLVDPRWGKTERAGGRAERENRRAEIEDRNSDGESGRGAVERVGDAAGDRDGWLCIPTGGTSGGVKFARHDERTVTAAARGFVAHFGLARVNAVDVLPPFHVSGLMARVRCAETGGRHVAWDWKRLERGERPVLGAGEWVVSLVPTQLQRLMADEAARDWLRHFAVVLLGGGPLWRTLADEAAEARLRIAPSYGMTETAAMVTALRPEAFLAGSRSSGTPLPHVRVTGEAGGAVTIEGESVFRGYHPERREARRFETQDEGRFDARGELHVIGRRDAVIITGGEKVNPAEVEAVLRAGGEFADVGVIGVPDDEWGAVVVACYPAGGGEPRWADVHARLAAELAPYKRPKRFVAVADWPRNAQGKLNRAKLVEAATAAGS